MSDIYTSSRLKVIRECLRKHYYRYTLGIRGPETSVMRFGTTAHAALEAWYRAWQETSSVDERWTAIDVALAQVVIDKYERAKLTAILLGYHTLYNGLDWEVLGVEQEFTYFLGDIEVRGKMDAIIRDRTDGRVWIVEHKSTGQDISTGSAYWERLALDTQVSIYIDGATFGLGYENVAGVIYDVLARPRHEPKIATPDAARKYTQGKGCKICGGNLQGKQGTGVVGDHACSICGGTGWRLQLGEPESPKLYAGQREADETPESFETRIIESIAKEPSAFLIRGNVVRLDDQLDAMRRDLIESILLERHATELEMYPRNDGACASFGSMCSFFPICSGAASVDDQQRFPRGAAHPELASAQ